MTRLTAARAHQNRCDGGGDLNPTQQHPTSLSSGPKLETIKEAGLTPLPSGASTEKGSLRTTTSRHRRRRRMMFRDRSPPQQVKGRCLLDVGLELQITPPWEQQGGGRLY